MLLKPCHTRVLIRITKADTQIVRPDSSGPLSGDIIEVVAKGEAVTCCAPGDQVMLSDGIRNQIGIERSVEGEKPEWATILIDHNNIIAVILPETPIS